MAADIPDYREKFAGGSLSEVNAWLVENVHRHGKLHDPGDLIKIITGSELTIEPFMDYLDEKYSKLYGY